MGCAEVLNAVPVLVSYLRCTESLGKFSTSTVTGRDFSGGPGSGLADPSAGSGFASDQGRFHVHS